MGLSTAQKRILETVLADDENNQAEAAILRFLQGNLRRFLAQADDDLRRAFFLHIEVQAPTSLARKIAVHAMRPDEVTKLVAEKKAEIQARKPSNKPSGG